MKIFSRLTRVNHFLTTLKKFIARIVAMIIANCVWCTTCVYLHTIRSEIKAFTLIVKTVVCPLLLENILQLKAC